MSINFNSGRSTGWNVIFGQQTGLYYGEGVWMSVDNKNVFNPENTSTVPADGQSWTNEIDKDGSNLRKVNGITYVSGGTPKYFQFDGVDDFFGGGPPESSYGGIQLSINLGADFAAGVWWNSANASAIETIWSIGPPATSGMELLLSARSMVLTIGGTSIPGTTFTIANNKWYYFGVTKTLSGYNMYVNGSYNSMSSHAFNLSAGATENFDGTNMLIGKGTRFAGASSKVGKMHIYEGVPLTMFNMRENFISSHGLNNDRIYGNDFTG